MAAFTIKISTIKRAGERGDFSFRHIFTTGKSTLVEPLDFPLWTKSLPYPASAIYVSPFIKRVKGCKKYITTCTFLFPQIQSTNLYYVFRYLAQIKNTAR